MVSTYNVSLSRLSRIDKNTQTNAQKHIRPTYAIALVNGSGYNPHYSTSFDHVREASP